MANPNYNKPVFAATPIIRTFSENLQSNVDYNSPQTGSFVTLITVAQDSGVIIEKITVTIASHYGVDPTPSSPQMINLFLYDAGTAIYSLFKSMHLPGGLGTNNTPSSSIQFKFEGGLLLPLNAQLLLTTVGGTTDNYNKLAIVLEGGSFDTV